VYRVRNSRGSIATVLALLLGIGLSTPIQAQDTTGSRSAEKSATGQAHSPTTAGGGYYIEFRVAQIGAYGHSYVAYGNVGGRQNFADLHPMGNYAIMALGHVLPVPANTEWDPDVLKLPVMSRYRRSLNAEQYKKLLAAVSTAKTNRAPYWNAVTNNCNHFIGELAQAIGLKVPGQFQVSYAFVPALKELNEGAVAGTGKSSGQHRAVATPRS
jgi:hypothetical protein